MEFYEYILAFLPHLWPLITAGGLFGFDAITTSYWPWGKRQLDRIPTGLRRNLEVIALVLGIFYAGFATWELEHKDRAEEHVARLKAEQQANVPHNEQKVIDRLSSDLVAARAEIDTLKQQRIEEGQARHLTEAERQKLTEALSPLVSLFPELKISAPGDGEAQGYAREFMSLFNRIGIKVARVGFIIPTSAGGQGMAIVVKDLNRTPDKANRFYQALQSAGFSPEGGVLPTLGEGDFELIISSKKIP